MESLPLFIKIFEQIGTTFGVGASTFALTFYIAALIDGEIDASERRFMGIVYVVLRIGMTLITLSLVLLGLSLALKGEGATLFGNSHYMMQVTLMGVIIINAILMTLHVIPMKIGPVLAGGSWYFLFLLGVFYFSGVAYQTLLMYYVLFLVLFFVLFTIIKNHFVRRP